MNSNEKRQESIEKISNLLKILLKENDQGRVVVAEEKTLFCFNINSNEKYRTFKENDEVLLVALMVFDVETLEAIHQALPDEVLYTKTIFDTLFSLNDNAKKAVIKYMLCIDNQDFDKYLNAFGHMDKIDDAIVQACINESKLQSFENNEVSLPSGQLNLEPCSPEGYRSRRPAKFIERHESVQTKQHVASKSLFSDSEPSRNQRNNVCPLLLFGCTTVGLLAAVMCYLNDFDTASDEITHALPAPRL